VLLRGCLQRGAAITGCRKLAGNRRAALYKPIKPKGLHTTFVTPFLCIAGPFILLCNSESLLSKPVLKPMQALDSYMETMDPNRKLIVITYVGVWVKVPLFVSASACLEASPASVLANH